MYHVDAPRQRFGIEQNLLPKRTRRAHQAIVPVVKFHFEIAGCQPAPGAVSTGGLRSFRLSYDFYAGIGRVRIQGKASRTVTAVEVYV